MIKIENPKRKKHCCIKTCKSADRALYRFPHNLELRNKWKEILKIESDINEDYVVCSNHFNLTNFFGVKDILRRNAVPDKNLPKEKSEENIVNDDTFDGNKTIEFQIEVNKSVLTKHNQSSIINEQKEGSASPEFCGFDLTLIDRTLDYSLMTDISIKSDKEDKEINSLEILNAELTLLNTSESPEEKASSNKKLNKSHKENSIKKIKQDKKSSDTPKTKDKSEKTINSQDVTPKADKEKHLNKERPKGEGHSKDVSPKKSKDSKDEAQKAVKEKNSIDVSPKKPKYSKNEAQKTVKEKHSIDVSPKKPKYSKDEAQKTMEEKHSIDVSPEKRKNSKDEAQKAVKEKHSIDVSPKKRKDSKEETQKTDKEKHSITDLDKSSSKKHTERSKLKDSSPKKPKEEKEFKILDKNETNEKENSHKDKYKNLTTLDKKSIKISKEKYQKPNGILHSTPIKINKIKKRDSIDISKSIKTDQNKKINNSLDEKLVKLNNSAPRKLDIKSNSLGLKNKSSGFDIRKKYNDLLKQSDFFHKNFYSKKRPSETITDNHRKKIKMDISDIKERKVISIDDIIEKNNNSIHKANNSNHNMKDELKLNSPSNKESMSLSKFKQPKEIILSPSGKPHNQVKKFVIEPVNISKPSNIIIKKEKSKLESVNTQSKKPFMVQKQWSKIKKKAVDIINHIPITINTTDIKKIPIVEGDIIEIPPNTIPNNIITISSNAEENPPANKSLDLENAEFIILKEGERLVDVLPEKDPALIPVQPVNVQNQMKMSFLGTKFFYEAISTPSELENWTGIKNSEDFKMITNKVETFLAENDIIIDSDFIFKIPLEEFLAIVMVQIKTNLNFIRMSTLFSMSDEELSNRFDIFLPILRTVLQKNNVWPSKKIGKSFNLIIEPLEFVVENEKSVDEVNHVKAMVGFNNSGKIIWSSNIYPQNVSYHEICVKEEVYEKLRRIDTVCVRLDTEINKEFKKLGVFCYTESNMKQYMIEIRNKVKHQIFSFDIFQKNISRTMFCYLDDILSIVCSVINVK